MMTSIAPSEAPAETPSVKGVASGLRNSAWNTTPDEASAAPTSAPASTRGNRAMNRICASTLVGKGQRRIERPAEVDGRAADERRQHARRHGEQSKPRHRERKAGADRPRRRDGVMDCGVRGPLDHPTRRTGVTVRWPAPSWHAHVGLDVVELPHHRAVSTSAVGPCPSSRPSRMSASVSQIDAARLRSCVAITIVTSCSRLKPPQQRRHLELVAEVERRGRLVEQQHVGALRQRAGDHHALASRRR